MRHVVSTLVLADMYDILSATELDYTQRNSIAKDLMDRIEDYPLEYFSGEDEEDDRQPEYE